MAAAPHVLANAVRSLGHRHAKIASTTECGSANRPTSDTGGNEMHRWRLRAGVTTQGVALRFWPLGMSAHGGSSALPWVLCVCTITGWVRTLGAHPGRGARLRDRSARSVVRKVESAELASGVAPLAVRPLDAAYGCTRGKDGISGGCRRSGPLPLAWNSSVVGGNLTQRGSRPIGLTGF
jgi:hypothetical protein